LFLDPNRRILAAHVGSERSIAMTPALPTEQQDEREEETRRPMWELAECTCPDFCERDHELD
jgi:hypothetical protein